MTILFMTYGLPASGKSIWAKQYQAENPYTKRVNKDLLRAMLDNSFWSKENEKFLLEVRDFVITQALQQRLDVICDDTNLDPKHEQTLRELAKKCNADFKIKDFSHVPLEECIRRDQHRPDYVGEKVIRQMYNRYLKPKTEQAVVPHDPNLRDCYIFDLDGTLAKMNGRGPFEWDKVDTDKPNAPVISICKNIAHEEEYHMLIVSGRDECCREKTMSWLRQHQIPNDALFMRTAGDRRDDRIIKQEIYEREIKGRYNVLGIFDDRSKVVEMWRSLGLPCFQVADGDF